ncbi:MAG TPA: type 4a pilus biogenesis protein PilO [Woeseiaceae bacterium]|nr:type 4a pilus biogenesis protein PilO [Woeseiaceae bacterium]
MNVIEELQSLDVNDVGRWPFAFRVAVIALVFVIVLGIGVWLTIIKDRAPQLARAEQEEQTLRVAFENKQRKAANYDAYKAQLAEIEQSFGTMLRQLPGETEIPSLIVDISQTGLAAGLQEKLFQPLAEIPKDFYAEKPIKIILSGGYHEIANFVSGVAALPRIVTLHDISITPENKDSYDQLSMEVTAKIYRYLEQGSGTQGAGQQ